MITYIWAASVQLCPIHLTLHPIILIYCTTIKKWHQQLLHVSIGHTQPVRIIKEESSINATPVKKSWRQLRDIITADVMLLEWHCTVPWKTGSRVNALTRPNSMSKDPRPDRCVPSCPSHNGRCALRGTSQTQLNLAPLAHT